MRCCGLIPRHCKNVYLQDVNGAESRLNLNGGGHKEELLLEAQLFAILSSIVGVKDRADVLSLALVLNRLQHYAFSSHPFL